MKTTDKIKMERKRQNEMQTSKQDNKRNSKLLVGRSSFFARHKLGG